MKLHVFNPEHEMALAANLDQYTSPRAGREMRSHLSFLPALWADDGDYVLVDDVDEARNAISQIDGRKANVQFVKIKHFPISDIHQICPWGWNRSIVHQLKRLQVSSHLLPTAKQLDEIREISNRKWASEHLLSALRTIGDDIVGEASYYSTFPKFVSPVVLKSPWSCSGRGVRYAFTEKQYMAHESWAKNIISQQGGVMIEPYYRHVMDFALEFESTKNGIQYLGLSLFFTNKGGYTGNVIASEEYKLNIVSQYVPLRILEDAKAMITERMALFIADKYFGPFGVDMMVVVDENHAYQLHPCVELNLRRTMGHVSLSFERVFSNPMCMSVKYNGRYRLDISPWEDDLSKI